MKSTHTNDFKISLFQEDVLLTEIIFSADNYNPFTRYSIDLRDTLPKHISSLQRLLSKNHFDCNILGLYDTYKINQKIINSYPSYLKKDMVYSPNNKRYVIEDKVISGVECKLGFYINENPIIEREFYVNGFNIKSRYSTELLYEMEYIADAIKKHIKLNDINNMWDDYDLINYRGMNINQIREMSLGLRNKILKSIRR